MPEDCNAPANNNCDEYVLDVDDPDCAPRSCSTQDDCGLNLESLACPRLSQFDDTCRRVCRSDDECGTGLACRGLPGSVSIGFCDDAGAIPLGGTFVTSSDCAQGMCDFASKTCRAICQSQRDCTGGEVCGRTEYNTLEFGGTNSRHFTTVCRPLGGRLDVGGRFDGANGYFYPEYCASDVCDAYPWAFGYTATAQCSEVCSGSTDCASNQVCSMVFNGLGAGDRYDDTQEGGGNNIDGMASDNTTPCLPSTSDQPPWGVIATKGWHIMFFEKHQ
ncbi:MAG: hypothetical protein GY822_20675 [Deltaproteobacteria bacterium]|nr:hypothetical protein [Deltaproteobacteria bacterium]